MQVGDLVRCKLTKSAMTLGVVIRREKAESPARLDAVHVLTGKQVFRWNPKRLEVVNGSR